IRSTIGLETIDANLSRRMQVPTRFSPERFNVTVIATRLSAEQFVSSGRCRWIEIYARLGCRSWNGNLIELQLRKLLCDPILVRIDMRQVGEAIGRGNR